MKTGLIAILTLLPILATANPLTETNLIEVTELQSVDLSGLTNFWQGAGITARNGDPSGVLFSKSSSFLQGRMWEAGTKRIAVALFRSQQDALACMDFRIKNVADVIMPETNAPPNLCAWSSGRCAFVNWRNAIIEVGNLDTRGERRADFMSVAQQVIKALIKGKHQ